MNLEHLIVPESKKELKRHTHTYIHTPHTHVKGAQKPTERVSNGQTENNLSNKINEISHAGALQATYINIPLIPPCSVSVDSAE